MQGGHGEIDQLDARKWQEQAAEAVDQEVAAQKSGGADRIADCGEASPMMLSADSAG